MAADKVDADRASSSSRRRQNHNHHHDTSSDSPSNTPPLTSHKLKNTKAHVVGARPYGRVPSHGKPLQKLAKTHAEAHPHPHPHPPPNSHAKTQRRTSSPLTSPSAESMKRSGSEPKLASRNGSTTSLKKNSSHVSLKRPRSHVEVKRPKSAGALKRSASQTGVSNRALQRTSVHFDLGNDGHDDAWTEASGSASPELSRSASVAGQSSGRSSAKLPASPVAPSPSTSPKRKQKAADRSIDSQTALDAQQITSRLLQRSSSMNAPPKMSSVSVTATANADMSDFFGRRPSTMNGISSDPTSSRFVGSNMGTPASTLDLHSSQMSSDPRPSPADLDSARRARSMGNLVRRNTPDSGSDSEERVLAPRSRKTSTGAHPYNPPQQSRTQQKLWLQRASSNIEPAQMAPGAAINGLGLGIGMPGIRPGAPLVGAGDDGRDPRIRLQLERTGLEYLVVRRYQDPVSRALKRLDKLPGMKHRRRIPRPERAGDGMSPRTPYGLSQSMKEMSSRRGYRGIGGERESGSTSASGHRSSYDGVIGDGQGSTTATGSVESDRAVGVEDGETVASLLRLMWEKNLDLNPSEE